LSKTAEKPPGTEDRALRLAALAWTMPTAMSILWIIAFREAVDWLYLGSFFLIPTTALWAQALRARLRRRLAGGAKA